STSFYQLVTQKPFFGDLTEDVLQYVSDEKKVRKTALMRKHRKNSILNKKLKQQKKQLSKSKAEYEKIEKELKDKTIELNRINKEYEKISKELSSVKNSRSWKYTSIFRRK